MPDFCTPFSVKKNNGMLTHEELVRALRFCIAAEYEAMQIYEELAESIDNAEAKKVLCEIRGDEMVHAGCFQRILNLVNPDEQKSYNEGHEEVDKLLGL
ncbi:MAG: ferritin family protein [Candidatus Gastranaerophilales bacterium]|nr:ferritin family protein [Candidatus Gastranaerophilales bacterium]